MLDLTGCFDGGAGKPLYEQFYEHLAEQIRQGRLVRGEKLPGKRTLAQQLAVAVNTVDAAYQMLVAEGYLEARPKSGFYVLDYAGGPARPAAPVPEEDPGEDGEGEGEAPAFDLATGAVDTDLFPFRTWGRIQKELLYARPELLSHGHRQGDEDLRRALADYLGAYRGVVCAPGQIVVGAGVEYLLGLVAQLLRGGTAAIENPGYARSRTILENSGVPCRCVDIDEGGLPAAGLEESGANLCYVTPSHHFPTAVTMPAGRRAQLLAWAARAPGRYILEDDYDAEFRFDMRPLPSLQGMAGPDGPVVYLCTFSKSLARRFLEEGYFARHLSRMRSAYKSRMEALVRVLEESFGREAVRLEGRHNGLHLLLTLEDGPGEEEMVAAARREGVALRGLGQYYMARRERCPASTVVLGYASLKDRDIPALVQALRRAWGR